MRKRSTTPARGWDGGAGEETGGEAKGAKAGSGYEEPSLVSGSGGLGEEGIVPAPAPEGKASPGEGRRGAISGESSWKGGEMVGVEGREEEREEREEREMKRMMMRSLLRKEEEAIFFFIILFWV